MFQHIFSQIGGLINGDYLCYNPYKITFNRSKFRVVFSEVTFSGRSYSFGFFGRFQGFPPKIKRES